MAHTIPYSKRRILVVDDTATIHDDIRKILCPAQTGTELLQAEAQLFGQPAPIKAFRPGEFEIDSALQGVEGISKVEATLKQGEPYALAFVDVRMPPGLDGIETVRRMWQVNPELQVIICTAYSDHSWEDITQLLGHSDSFVILKKPFDNIEVLQLAHALTRKWELARAANMQMSRLNEMVHQQTAELRAANQSLQAEVRRRETTELELQGSEHRFSLAFKASAIPMGIMHAPSRTYIEVNDSFTKLTGHDRAEIIGKTPNEIKLLTRPEDCDNAMNELRRHGLVRNHPLRIFTKSGETRDAMISLEPVVLGEETCVLVAMLDVTEQRQLETQLRQSQKMEAIGQLAAGVAHDFNNLLTIIHGHASLQMARSTPDQHLNHSLTQVKLAADRAAALTRQLLAFSRKQVMQPKPMSLNEAIERSHAMLKRLIGETVSLECACAKDLPLVWADESSIDQILINLAVNARDAMPNGGNLNISTTEIAFEQADSSRHPDARPGRFVRLTVADNGCGMDTSVLNRIFEPFFTTKAPGKGTGLGLSTVYGIVKQHQGWVEVESAPGLGSRFHIYLEVTTKTHGQNSDDTRILNFEAGASRPKKETILVVEDEAILREFVTAILREQGYQVLEASDGLEALQTCEQTATRIDLLLTDMVMPNGISGAKLATQMLARRKGMKVLYTSGYSQELMENSGHLIIGTNFLPKPFDVNKLMKAVHRCLESPAPKAAEAAVAAV